MKNLFLIIILVWCGQIYTSQFDPALTQSVVWQEDLNQVENDSDHLTIEPAENLQPE